MVAKYMMNLYASDTIYAGIRQIFTNNNILDKSLKYHVLQPMTIYRINTVFWLFKHTERTKFIEIETKIGS